MKFKIDVLGFLAMPDESAGLAYSRQHYSLGNALDIITPIDSSGYGQWKHIKNPRGWPWDLKLYDNNYIYDWITEGPHGWSDDPAIGPKSFKKFVQNHMSPQGAMADGLIMFPRFIDTLSNSFERSTRPAQNQYIIFENCLATSPAQSLGPITQRLAGPYLLNHGGDVGEQPTLIHQYEWSDNGIPAREENYYALNWGWVTWKQQTLNLKTLFYETVNQTIANQVSPVAEVKVVFPCF